MTAAPVAQAAVQALCPLCERPAMWAIGSDALACSRDLGRVMEDLHRANPRPFQPYLPTPLKRGRW